MKVSFDSRLTPDDMYEFHMYHAYTSSQGWISLILGVLGIAAGILTFGKVDTFYTVSYIILGNALLLYLPLIFKQRAKRQVESSEVLRNVLHYTLSEEGVGVATDVYETADMTGEAENPEAASEAGSEDEAESSEAASEAESKDKAADATPQNTALLPWDSVYKAVTTKNELLIFSSRVNAYVIPKRDIGALTAETGEVLRANLKPHRLNYKW